MPSNLAYQLPFHKIGQDVQIWGGARIVGANQIALGDSVIVDDFVFLMGGQETRIGSFVHIGAFTSITGGGKLVMEDFAGLSGGVRLYTGNEDYLGGSLTNPAVPSPYRQPARSFVHLKPHVIVGSNAVILPGVILGEGAVVGANSLVRSDLEPWTIYAGSPAKPVKNRPREKMMELERRLRQELYRNGQYIPKAERAPVP